jgi:hypothetical protein
MQDKKVSWLWGGKKYSGKVLKKTKDKILALTHNNKIKTIKVNSHTRARKNGVSVVRRHLRTLQTYYKIDTPIEVNLDHKATQSDSLAHHELRVDPKRMRPKKHLLNIDSEKVIANGESLSDIIRHEMSHILDVELANKKGTFKKPTDTFSQSEEGKKLIKPFKKGMNKNRSNKEIFADNLKL